VIDMAWLMRGGDVLASVDVAATAADRFRGRATLAHGDGVLWCEGARIAHSIGSPCALDVAYLDHDWEVLAVTGLRRFRIGRPRPGAHCILEARAGAFNLWNLKPGDRLEIRE
jgi:uncharacterized membrane protein (UPF0127 family)